jgi:hypothetical protein
MCAQAEAKAVEESGSVSSSMATGERASGCC